MDVDEASKDPGVTAKTTPKQTVAKRSSRFQLKCAHCEFRVGTLSVLENHARNKHLDQEGFRCKLCNFYSATSQWMEVHLCSDGHTQREDEEKRAGLSSFQAYVERVSIENLEEGVIFDEIVQVTVGERDVSSMGGAQGAEEAADAAKDASAEEEEDLDDEPPKKKRGRPKQGATSTCGYCGLVVSNATNLSVHVRRKHSKEYGYSCTLCNYSCVTKGDMDRHCITKKHFRRVQDCAKKNLLGDTRASPQGATAAQAQEPNTDGQASDTEQGPDRTAPEEQTPPEPGQGRSRSDSANACCHCDFVAHSPPALHLHIKRKHIKDFEYVCLACSYYAVTNREMTRHANTEKHKQKSQKYAAPLVAGGQTLPSKPVGADATGPTEGSEACSDEVREEAAATSVTAEPAGPPAAAAAAGGADEKHGGSSPSSSEPNPTDVPPEAQQTPAELQPGQPESLEDGATIRTSSSDTQMSTALAFDSCIVSVKDLAEQALQQGPAGEDQAPAVGLGGGSPKPSGLSPSNSSYVKKFKGQKAKVRDEAKGASSRIRCEDCGFLADGLSGLNVHISMKHPSKEKHFHCLVCGKSFYTESNLHQHLTSAAHQRNEQNSVEKLPEGGASFKCVKCTNRFESEQDLFVHIKEKHEELLREVNKYVLEDTEQINREREENQGSVCKYCGKVCKSSNSMAFLAHVRTHTGM